MKKRYVWYLIVGGACLIALSFIVSAFGDSSYIDAAKAGGDYLVRHLNEDGSFVYEYDPIRREASESYNILRHAGTTYSLLELYEATGDARYLSAAERALGYLRDSIVPCPRYAGALCVFEDDEIKVGGNGLALLALTEYMDITGSRDDVPLAEGLARFLVGVQRTDGEFAFFKMDGRGVPDTEFISLYYPGEAFFGLSRLSVLTGERQWILAAHKGARWIIEVRDSGTKTEELEHDHWMLYALHELYADAPEALYVGHAARLTTAIIAAQHTDRKGDEADWNGGYYEPPRSTPTATRNEGLGAAYELFMDAGEEAYAIVAKDAMERGIGFTLRTQFTPAKLRATGADPNALGGFHESLDDYRIRIDYVQHNISALLAFERIRKQ